MTDRERMIKLLADVEKNPDITCPSPKNVGACRICKYKINDVLCDAISREADYLLEHGVIVPPCKFLSKCYVLPTRNNNLSDITEMKCLGFILSQDSYNANLVTEKNKLYQPCFGAFGKAVFLTREEAEQALKERDGA